MTNIEIKNPYFAYLIGLGENDESDEFFKDLKDEFKDPNDNRYTGLIIKPYSISEYESHETHYLLSNWIAEALDRIYTNSYKTYNQKHLDIIYNRTNYEDVKKSVIEEIKRIYNKTQEFLNTKFPNNDDIILYRCLNDEQNEQFLYNQPITFNFITSYFSSRSISYSGRITIPQRVRKTDVLAYINLAYNGITLGELEDEVIVIHS